MQFLQREEQNLMVVSKLKRHSWSEDPLMPDNILYKGLVACCGTTRAMTSMTVVADMPNVHVREHQQYI